MTCERRYNTFDLKKNNKTLYIEVKIFFSVLLYGIGAGLSARGLAGPVTGQGGGGAALASALNLDKGVDSYFRGSKDEECYGRVKLQPLIFVDDLLRGSKDINCLRAGCVKLDYVLRSKQLEAHPTKSGFLVFGSEQFKAKAKDESPCYAWESDHEREKQ